MDIFSGLTTSNKDGDLVINNDLFNLQDEEFAKTLSLQFPGFEFEALTYSNNGKTWKNSEGSKMLACFVRP